MWNSSFIYILVYSPSWLAIMVEVKHPVEIAIRLVVSTCTSYYSELVRASKFCGEERSWFNKVLKRVEICHEYAYVVLPRCWGTTGTTSFLFIICSFIHVSYRLIPLNFAGDLPSLAVPQLFSSHFYLYHLQVWTLYTIMYWLSSFQPESSSISIIVVVFTHLSPLVPSHSRNSQFLVLNGGPAGRGLVSSGQSY